jgi:signal transduction histidine kinase
VGLRVQIGVRGRLAIVLVTAASIAVTLLVVSFRPLVIPGLSRARGERLLWTARAAAAGAPHDSARWDAWAGELADAVPGVETFVLRIPPGQPGFSSECAEHGVALVDALEAYGRGEAIAATAPDEADAGEGDRVPGTGWGALVRLTARSGERALLGVYEAGPAVLSAGSVWTFWLLLVAMAFVLVVVGGYLAAYGLLVRPIERVAATVRRASSPQREGADAAADFASLSAAATDLARQAREAASRSGRQAVELARIRQDFTGAQATLLRAEKLASVGQLAAGIAHEIGNPLGIVLGLSDVLRSGDTNDEDVRKYAADIHAATLRVHGILKDLLAFARPAREEGATADVPAVVEETVQLLRPQKRFKDVSLHVDPGAAPIVAEIKPSQLQQILVNLLLNAADAMGGRGRIEVAARVEDRYVLVDVTDQGPGVRAEDRDRIFDPFYTTKPPGEGTGLGLAICAQIADAYGGGITVESPDRGGARFTLRLWRAGDE